MQLPLMSLHSITQWLSPDYLLHTFGSGLFWVGIIVLFVECGLFFPFLPGDTLLFALGLFLATDKIQIIPGPKYVDLLFALVVYVAAAFAGNVVGYEIGNKLGPAVYRHDGRIIKRKYLDQTAEFFEEHGNPALVIGRFVPFVRTYITLVAGITRMQRHRFFVWSFAGALLWVVSVTGIGFVLGKTFPALGHYIDLVTYGLLLVTVAWIGVELWKKRRDPDPGLPPAYRDDAES